ncbi:rhodanese-like domain-containing protein [Aporhodopirellula aestuarii]|uniref:Rhodanese-like domain-containing protein n=1 Tax=Aporhodopirellula aestuarii TaxID=2950107 RepID=A0ABT0U3K5_9BACT|nr:rhodanese-like domain-containing protein [Aporhodopirellula aestuarii]MCM2371457.1 rhodanese-like domain-containing protein [Aporhodopirellula aestuarii]
MKYPTLRLVALFAFVVPVLLGVSPAPAQFGGFFGGPKIDTISTDDLHKMLVQKQQSEAKAREAGKPVPLADFVVVDVRSEAEVNVSVIPGAVTKAEFEKNAEKYRGKLVIPYCTVGGRSGAYAKELVAKGVKVKNYQGSILKWVGAGLPVVTLDGELTNRVHTYSDRYKIPPKYEQVTR